ARSKRIKNVVSLQWPVSVVANQEAIRIGMSPRDYLSGSKPRMHSFETVWRNSCSRFKHCAMHSAVRGPKFRAWTHKSRLHILVYATLSDPLATTHRARDLLVRGMRTKSAAVDRRVAVVTDRTTFTTSCADPPH